MRRQVTIRRGTLAYLAASLVLTLWPSVGVAKDWSCDQSQDSEISELFAPARSGKPRRLVATPEHDQDGFDDQAGLDFDWGPSDTTLMLNEPPLEWPTGANSGPRDGRELTDQSHDPRIGLPAEGFTYPLDQMRVIRGFDDAKCWHQGIDVYSRAPYFGTGKPVYAITQSKVTFIGTPDNNDKMYGRWDTRPGFIERKGVRIPRVMEVANYGQVHPFTATMGRARTGILIVTKSLHPKYRD